MVVKRLEEKRHILTRDVSNEELETCLSVLETIAPLDSCKYKWKDSLGRIQDEINIILKERNGIVIRMECGDVHFVDTNNQPTVDSIMHNGHIIYDGKKKKVDKVVSSPSDYFHKCQRSDKNG